MGSTVGSTTGGNAIPQATGLDRQWNGMRKYDTPPAGAWDKTKAHLATAKDAFTPSRKNEKGVLYNGQTKPGYDASGKPLAGFANKLARNAGRTGLAGLVIAGLLGGIALFSGKQASGQQPAQDGNPAGPPPPYNEGQPPPAYGAETSYDASGGSPVTVGQSPMSAPSMPMPMGMPVMGDPLGMGVPPYIP